MNEKLKEKLEMTGVDVRAGIERFMGNEGLYLKFTLRFLDDLNAQKLTDTFAEGDMDAALTAAHTLKGVCGNLSFQTLFNNASEITNLLREDKAEEAKAKLPELQKNYRELTEILREYSQ